MNRSAVRRFVIALLVGACALGLVSQSSADTTLTIGDANFLGSIIPGTPANLTEEAGYVTQLGNMAANAAPVTISGNTFNRSANTLCFNCPDATTVDAVNVVTGDGDNINGTGFLYLLAKYGNDSVVWYIGGLTGPFDIPDQAPESFNGKGLSHYSLFNPSTTTVPEPATVLLLGSAFAGIAFVCRKLLV